MDYKALFEELSHFDTPTVCNALITMFPDGYALSGYGKPGMKLCSGSDKPMVGFAITGKISATEPVSEEERAKRNELYKLAGEAEYPTIVCLEDIDERPIGSFWGEMQASAFKALGSIATITEGGVRDLDGAVNAGFNFYATTVLVSRAYVHVVETDCPVTIREQVINPGDIIHVDKHGFAVFSKDIAQKVLYACKGVTDIEKYLLDPCRACIKENRRATAEEIIQWFSESDRAKKELMKELNSL